MYYGIGVGPEVVDSALAVIQALQAPVEFVPIDFYDHETQQLRPEALNQLQKAGVGLFGPFPSAEAERGLRAQLGLFLSALHFGSTTRVVFDYFSGFGAVCEYKLTEETVYCSFTRSAAQHAQVVRLAQEMDAAATDLSGTPHLHRRLSDPGTFVIPNDASTAVLTILEEQHAPHISKVAANERVAVFQPHHGCLEQQTLKNTADPTSCLWAAVHALRHLDLAAESERLQHALGSVVLENRRTDAATEEVINRL